MDKYARAQERIAEGLWSVDPEIGQVYNHHGKPIGSVMDTGYIFLSMAPRPDRRGNQNCYAHRVIWESEHGPIPDGLQVNHINGVKADNRISNLELVTPSGNARHAYATGLAVSVKGDANPQSKLTTELVKLVRMRAARGDRQRDIAADVGISRQHVSRVIRGERWSGAA